MPIGLDLNESNSINGALPEVHFGKVVSLKRLDETGLTLNFAVRLGVLYPVDTCIGGLAVMHSQDIFSETETLAKTHMSRHETIQDI